MANRDTALQTARRSPRIARLSAATIVAGARLRLGLGVSESEAYSLAHDYLPKDAVERVRINRERERLRSLPDQYRDRAAVSQTVIDGVSQTGVQQVAGGRTGIGGWIDRLPIRFQAWTAARRIESNLRDRAAEHTQQLLERDRGAAEIESLIEDVTRRNDDAILCLESRQDYAVKVRQMDLPPQELYEAIAALDRIIDYHLAMAIGGQFVQRD